MLWSCDHTVELKLNNFFLYLNYSSKYIAPTALGKTLNNYGQRFLLNVFFLIFSGIFLHFYITLLRLKLSVFEILNSEYFIL